MKYLFILLFFIASLYSKEYVYFLPYDSNRAKKHIIKLIDESKKSIDIAMYNLSHKKIIKQLIKSKKNGTKINLFLEKGKNLKKLNFKKLDKKLHTKLAIFDEKIVVFGSANWKKESFSENYEIIYISDDKNLVNKFNNFFKGL